MTITLEHYRIDMEDYLYLDFMANPVVPSQEWMNRISQRTWAVGARAFVLGPFFENGVCYWKTYWCHRESEEENLRVKRILVEKNNICLKKWKGIEKEYHIGTMKIYDRFLL